MSDCAGLVHGPDAGADLGRRVREASLLSEAVLLVRGAGRPLGLGPYDADEVFRAIADSPVPVVCGLGGAGVATAANAVAYNVGPDRRRRRRLGAGPPGGVPAAGAARAARRRGAGGTSAAVSRAWTELEEVSADTVRGGADEALVRAQEAERKRWVRLEVGALLVAALVIGVGARHAARRPRWPGCWAPVLVLAGVWVWSKQARTRGSRRMESGYDEFCGGGRAPARRSATPWKTTSSPRSRCTGCGFVVRGSSAGRGHPAAALPGPRRGRRPCAPARPSRRPPRSPGGRAARPAGARAEQRADGRALRPGVVSGRARAAG